MNMKKLGIFLYLSILILSLFMGQCAPRTGETGFTTDDGEYETGYIQAVSPDTLANLLLTLAEEHFTEANEALKNENYNLAHQIASDGMRYLLDIPIEEVYDSFIISRYNLNLRRISSAQIRAANGLWGYPVMETTEQLLINITVNDRIEQIMNYYTGGGRSSMMTYLRRSGKYLPMIEDVLEDYNLPHDIAYLPIIESGYSPNAISPASAAGVWQFIPATARTFGLKINSYVDERRDPHKSTIAAARYLSSLYERFGDWNLALAAYNCGEHCVERAINSAGTDDYWRLSLPNETMGYVPAALAVMLIAREPEIYGMSVNYETPWQYDTVYVHGPVNLSLIANSVGCSKDDLKELNPQLLQSFTPPGETLYLVRIPPNTNEMFHVNFDPLPESEKYLSQSTISSLTAPPPPQYRTYTIREGDTLTRIASRLGVTVEDLKRWNPSVRERYLSVGSTLRYRSR